MAVNATPTFTPTGGQVANASTFTIACVTEGVTIYYSFGDAPANIGWTEYVGAVTLPDTGATSNVSAYAVKDGETDSAVGTATFYTVGYSAAVSAAAPAVLDTNATQGLGSVCEGIGKTGSDGASIGASRIGGAPGTDLKIETNA